MRAVLPRRARLRRTDDIRAVLRHGRRIRSGPVDIFLSGLASDPSRAGFIVPLHGRSAVERNRLKRRLREIVRLTVLPRLAERGTGVDLIVRTRPGAYDCSYAELTEAVSRAFRDIEP